MTDPMKELISKSLRDSGRADSRICYAPVCEKYRAALEAIERKAGVVNCENASWGGALREIAHMAQEALKE